MGNNIVYFIGLNPSKKNTDLNTPFVGTQSFNRLRQWLDSLKVCRYVLMNVSSRVDFKKPTQEELDTLKDDLKDVKVVIALGVQVKSILDQLNIECFALPHPSGRNRMLNNKGYVRTKLTLCNEYIAKHE